MDITLHKEKGLNVHLTFCQRCGGETNELAFCGNRNWTGICPIHGYVCMGPRTAKRGYCPHKGCDKQLDGVHELADRERVAGTLCDTCRELLEKVNKVLADGGVRFRCRQCQTEGVIARNEDNAATIDEIKGKGFGGVEIDNCPGCNKNGERNGDD